MSGLANGATQKFGGNGRIIPGRANRDGSSPGSMLACLSSNLAHGISPEAYHVVIKLTVTNAKDGSPADGL
jgi:hypothetical protein